jgi:anti-sigma factor RsiW
MSAYLDGELESRSRARMERHSDECADCGGVLHSLQRMLGLLHGLPAATAQAEAPDIAAAVRARLNGPGSS